MASTATLCRSCFRATSSDFASSSRRTLGGSLSPACHHLRLPSANASSSSQGAQPTHNRANALAHFVNARSFHTTSTPRFPRSVVRSRREAAYEDIPPGEDDYQPFDATTTQQEGHDTAKPASSAPEDASIPWFLQGESVQVNPPEPTPSPPTVSSLASSFDLPANVPAALRLVHAHLLTGPSSGLLYKPSFSDHEDDGSPSSSISYLHVAPLQEGLSWCDWIAIVTVRENTGGGINATVARDIGELLSRVGPPAFDGSGDANGKANKGLDDILGPNESLSGVKDAYGPSSKQRLDRISQRELHQEDTPLEPLRKEPPAQWSLQKSALAAKYPTWKPLKILSRETQTGLRILHSSDPHKWTAPVLSSHFKVSVDAVRRILKAKPERWGGDAVEKGLRRVGDTDAGPERWKREEAEIERLMGSLGRDGVGEEDEVTFEGQEDNGVVEQAEPSGHQISIGSEPTAAAAAAAAPLDVRSLGKPRYPVRYEGLPSSSTSSRSAARKALAASQGKNAAYAGAGGESSGEWVLVDAGWCVLHVMTPKARSTYDVAGVWKDLAQEQAREEAGASRVP